jgi:hypothetical protein
MLLLAIFLIAWEPYANCPGSQWLGAGPCNPRHRGRHPYLGRPLGQDQPDQLADWLLTRQECDQPCASPKSDEALYLESEAFNLKFVIIKTKGGVHPMFT